MRKVFTPIVEIPKTPPMAPHDPPGPVPQAAAWRRALAVVKRLTRPQWPRSIG